MTMTSNLPRCCMDFDIALEHLIFPERLPAAGLEFIHAHGIARTQLALLIHNAIDMGNGIVKIQHRCDQLQDDGRCGIYDARPQICRDFECSTRNDCVCGGQGLIQVD